MQTLNTSRTKKKNPSTIENTLPTNIKTHHHPSHPTHFVISCRFLSFVPKQSFICCLPTRERLIEWCSSVLTQNNRLYYPSVCPLAFVSIARTLPSHSSSCVHPLFPIFVITLFRNDFPPPTPNRIASSQSCSARPLSTVCSVHTDV